MGENNSFDEIIRIYREELIIINSDLRDNYIKNSNSYLKDISSLEINSAAYRIAKYNGEYILEFGNKAIELFENYISLYKLEIIDAESSKKIFNIIDNLLRQICSDSRRRMEQYAASRGVEHRLNTKTYQIDKELESRINPILKKLKLIIEKHNVLINNSNNTTQEKNSKASGNNKFSELINRYKILLKNSTYENIYKGDYQTLKIETEYIITTLFGENELKNYNEFSKVKASVISAHINYDEELKKYKEEISKIIAKLEGYKNIVKEKKANINKNINSTNFNKIFIAHGHNELMKQSVARVIEKQKIEAVILHEKPNRGKTVIEKFESNSDVGSAIILFTGDDYGYEKNSDKNNAKLRPRQNVIFEMGYFFGKLGREKVICLFEENIDIEVLSDYKGIIYIPYDSKGSWKYELGKELKEIGFNFDFNKVK